MKRKPNTFATPTLLLATVLLSLGCSSTKLPVVIKQDCPKPPAHLLAPPQKLQPLLLPQTSPKTMAAPMPAFPSLKL